ncbi:MAG: ATP-binding protein [Desulfobacteraceae bacterium]|nr:ATP-binding protein [Desulfobacteraceae bacterium]
MLLPPFYFDRIVTKLVLLISLVVAVLIGILMTDFILARQTENMVINLIDRDIPRLIGNEELSRKLGRLSDDIHLMLIHSTVKDYRLESEIERLIPVLNDIVSSTVPEMTLKQELKDFSISVTDLFNHCMTINKLKQRIQSDEKNFIVGINTLEGSVMNLLIDRKLRGREYELSSLEQISALITDLRNLVLQIKILVSESERTYISGADAGKTNQEQILSMLSDIESGLTTATTAGNELLSIGEALIDQAHDYKADLSIFYEHLEALETKISLLENRQSAVKKTMAATGKEIEEKTGKTRKAVLENLRIFGSIMVLSSLLILALLILTGIIGLKIARPIQELTDSAMGIAAGNLDKEIQIGGNDEVGILSRSFAGMRDAIKEKIEDLAEKNKALSREILERKRIEDALRKSENKYRVLLENLPQKIFHKDTTSVYVSANESYCRDLKIHPENIIGKTDYDFFPKQIAEKYIADDKRIMASGKAEEIEEKYVLGKQEFTINTIKTPIKNDKGEITGVLGIFWDITHTKQLERQLAQSQKMEAIGTLAGGIAHDFNNILSAIIGYAELSQMITLPENKISDYLSKILMAGGRAKDLVQQILTFSRQTEHERKPLSVKLIAKEALKLLRASLPSTIDVFEDIGSDSLVMGDPTQIHQILMNLCTNAGHAMQKTGGTLKVSLKDVVFDPDDVAPYPDLKTGTYLNLTVSDTGYGIAPDILERIFDPFFTTKGKGEGTGLGLAVVHGIVKNYGGMISVSSEPGKGASFEVFFPVVDTRPESVQTMAAAMLPGGTERILLADDEPALVEVGKHLLESLGYNVTATTSPEKALEIFKAHPGQFDLVITDMTMPHMTGDLLALNLFSIRPDIPVMLITGFSSEINEKKAKELGIKGFLTKPIIKSELAALVRTILDEAGDKNPD